MDINPEEVLRKGKRVNSRIIAQRPDCSETEYDVVFGGRQYAIRRFTDYATGTRSHTLA